LQGLSAQGSRDSAGIRIVENSRPQRAGAHAERLLASPLLIIGPNADTSHQFSRIAGAGRLADGRIVVADAGSRQLRFFTPAGGFIKAVGRKGDGPGEFGALGAFSILPGDTLAAGDPWGRIEYFTNTGRFIHFLDAINPPIQITPGNRLVLALMPGGYRLIASTKRPAMPSPGMRLVDSYYLAIVGGKNAVAGSIGAFPAYVLQMAHDEPVAPLFAPAAFFAANRGAVFAGFSAEYSIRVYSLSGHLDHIIRRQWSPLKVTRAVIDSFAILQSSTRGSADSATVLAAIKAAPSFATLPAFSQLIADRVGRLWVREAGMGDGWSSSPSSDTPTTWSVFDPQGLWVDDVVMPARFTPTEIGADYVLGIARDDSDVESVEIFRLAAGQ
jgi:hypothetical protein